jgi:hypothetical protein
VIEKQRVKISKEAQVNTYAEMFHASHVMLYKAEKDVGGSYYQLMASLIFTAFTLEAYLNHIGERIFVCWDDLEQLSPQRKLNVIAEKMGIERNEGERPYQTIKELFKFRNEVAHGKSVFLKSDDHIVGTNTEIDKYMSEPLEPKWKRYCSLKNAKRAREDVKNVITEFHAAAGITDDFLFNTGIWSGHATLIQ